jgi:hypothetical protein
VASKRTTKSKPKAAKKPAPKAAKKPAPKAAKKPAPKAAKKPAPKAAKKPAARAKAAPDVAREIEGLAKLLATYAPSRMATVRGATSFAKLEALVTVPSALRSLWSWADGASELLVLEGHDLERSFDLLSVDDAARSIEINRDAGDFADDLVPFASESGSGDCYALDSKGRVLYWDHEEGEASLHAASLSNVLKLTKKSIQEESLFGGPERKPGEVDPKVQRLDDQITKEIVEAKSIPDHYASPAHTIREAIGKVTSRADKHRLNLRLRDALRDRGVDKSIVDRVEEAIFHSARETRSWEDGLASLRATGGVVGDSDNWSVLALEALVAGEPEIALRAFAGGPSADSVLGEVALARKLGRTPTRSVDSVAAEIVAAAEKAVARTPVDAGDWARMEARSSLVNRAIVEKLRGDDDALHAVLDRIYSYPLGDRFRDAIEASDLAQLAGLEPRA